MEGHLFPGDVGTLMKDPLLPSQVILTPVISLLIYVQTQRSVKEVASVDFFSTTIDLKPCPTKE